MSVSARFIRRPIGTSLLALAILLVGAAVFPLLPVAPLPQVDFPTILVTANLPGGSPQSMASTVAQPLERQFSQIAGLSQMTSQSTLGQTQITLQFDLARNIDGAALDVQTAINAAGGQLPADLPSPPAFRKINPADFSILQLAVQSETLPLTTVNEFADTILAQQISQVEGVGQVLIFGQQKAAVRLQVDPVRLAAVGLSLEAVRSVVASATVSQPKGTLDGLHQSFTVDTNDQIVSAQPWNDVVLAYKNGAPIRVRDVGHAVAGPEDVKQAAWVFSGGGAGRGSDAPINGRALVLGVFKEPGANVVDTVARVRSALPRFEASLPPAVHVATLVDRTQNIRASVEDVEFTLVLTIALVVMVIFVFLRNVAATLIPGVTVPLALLGTAAVMYLVGYSLDNLSLMALTISVGFVVDDAIVMLENIYRHIEDGMEPMEAATQGAAEIGFTIVSISISLVAVFIPLLLMGGIVGRLFREFAVTVTLAIGVSLAVSLTLTPMLCSRFIRPQRSEQHGRLFRLFERGFERMARSYRRGLQLALRHDFATLCIFVATLVATGALFVVVPKGFFPQQDTGFISGFAETAQDASSSAMRARLLQLADIIRADPDVAAFSVRSGATFNTGGVSISLRPKSEGRTASADQVIRRLRAATADVEGVELFMQAGQDINVGGRSSRTQYQYTLTDTDLDELNGWAPRVLARLRALPALTDVASDQQNNAATAAVTIDRARAASFGISPALVDATINDAIGQRQVAQYFTQTNSYHVVLEVTPELQRGAELFDKLYLTSPLTGQPVPLSSMVHVDTNKTGYLSVNHQGQFPAVTISFNLAPGAALGEAVNAIVKAQAEIGAPQTLYGSFQGTAQAFQSSLATQPYLVAAAIVAVYIVLGLLYESYIHPLTILSTLPSAGVGALAALMLAGYDLSVIALIGIILLIGIVKKNGIMMVDFAIAAERAHGLPPRQAIYRACLLRFRPIMMTTMCTLFAGLPLMLSTGAGSELRRPLGYAMVGGLILSQAMTLFTTPVIYLYLDRAHLWWARRRAARQARPAAANA
ncbi:MAG: efflux RND transporter permease subunit [Burkholderiales bacterium]|nr:efflux RND transporter permease subunit [Burkholderiales bacterium]